MTDIESLQRDVASGKSTQKKRVGRGGTPRGGRGVAARTGSMMGSILEYGRLQAQFAGLHFPFVLGTVAQSAGARGQLNLYFDCGMFVFVIHRFVRHFGQASMPTGKHRC